VAHNRDRPIIIGGSHRSGTTLVRRLLNGHPRIYCPPEIKFHKDLLGQFPNDPIAHGRLGASMAAHGLPENVWLDEFGRAFIRCFELAAARNGKKRWADKNPENTINIRHWDRLLGRDFDFILVVRHPFDIIASIDEIKMNRSIPTNFEDRVEHVRTYIESGLNYCAENPLRSSIVRYERLVSDPRATLKEMLARIGEEFDAAMLANPGTDRHGRGLEDPKAPGRHQISQENVRRWARDFTPDQVERLHTELGALMGRLGYNLR
jgi:protein-tyrosine sulfotransferase